jgi:RNA polymerase sigma-70 factor (ECF subfamily)
VGRAEPTDAQVLAGPREGFGLLFERYSGILYGYCARRVGADLAEDLVAETFLTVVVTGSTRSDQSPEPQPLVLTSRG